MKFTTAGNYMRAKPQEDFARSEGVESDRGMSKKKLLA